FALEVADAMLVENDTGDGKGGHKTAPEDLAIEQVRDVPNLDCLVPASGRQDWRFGREGQAEDFARMLQRADLTPGRRVKEPYVAGFFPIAVHRGKKLAVGREGDSPDLAAAQIRGGHQLLCFGIPDRDRAVASSGREQSAV